MLRIAQAKAAAGADCENGGYHEGIGPRRQQVLRMAGQGYGNKAIASEMGIAKSTVDDHLKRHRARFGPTPRAALRRALGDDGLT